MKSLNIICLSLLAILLFAFSSCQKNETEPLEVYDCNLLIEDPSDQHPRAGFYQKVLDDNRKKGLAGAVLLVKDGDGLWMGASGQADIATGAAMQSCHTFLIASISKVFTSTTVYRYVDKGILTLDDPVNKWIDRSITDKVKNANEATIAHLLAHTSGIADYYTIGLELDRINKISNGWSKEEVLEYTYGVKPTNEVGETYYYSNTNFLLLSMILESAAGKSFEQIYREEIFEPLNLASAYYSESQPIPTGAVKGYVDIYGNGQLVESEFLYGDELGIGGDGGIAINAYDLALFLESLAKGQLISEQSWAKMTDWFDLPEDYVWKAYGQDENGFGVERFNTAYGSAIGHTGGVDGFSTFAYYFPEEDRSYILLTNSSINERPDVDIFNAVMEEMFK